MRTIQAQRLTQTRLTERLVHSSVARGARIADRLGELSPKIFSCNEHEPISVPMQYVLGANGRMMLHPEIENGDYFSVSLRRGTLTLFSRGYVGYIPINDRVIVNVRPRVPVTNLAQLADLAGVPRRILSTVRHYELTGTWSESLIDLYAAALAGHVDNIALNGLIRDYRREEQGSSFPKGRILMGPTLQKYVSHGQNYRAYNAWFTRTADNPMNRCLKYAIWLIAQYYIRRSATQRSRRIWQRINASYNMFDGVLLDHSRTFLADPTVTGKRDLPSVRAYYRDALDVALAIIHQRGLMLEDSSGRGIQLPSIVLDMSSLFEAYIRKSLQLYAVEHDWQWDVLDGNSEGSRPLYRGQASPAATPDIVVQGRGIIPLVFEVKYIPVDGSSSRDAVNQAITYANCYEANRVVLVHPCKDGQASGMHKLGDVGEIEVLQYRFDLSSSDLAGEVNRFAHAVEESVVPVDLQGQLTYPRGVRDQVHSYSITFQLYSDFQGCSCPHEWV